MEIGSSRHYLEFHISAASVSCIDARRPSEDIGIGDQAEIGKQILPIISEKTFYVLGSGLFVPFQQDDDVVAQLLGLDEIEDGQEMDEELPFIVCDSSAIDLVLADIEREWIILPSCLIGGLDIIMPVQQHRRERFVYGDLPHYDRIAIAVDDLGHESMVLQHGIEIDGDPLDIILMIGIHRNALHGDELLEYLIIGGIHSVHSEQKKHKTADMLLCFLFLFLADDYSTTNSFNFFLAFSFDGSYSRTLK